MSLNSNLTRLGFDYAFNAQHYGELNPDLADLDEPSLIRHFFLFGIGELRRFSYSFIFDPDFYRVHYPDCGSLSANEAYDHWVRAGALEGRSPSGPMLIKQSVGLELQVFPYEFSAEIYAAHTGMNGADKWACLEHFSLTGFRNHALVRHALVGPRFLEQLGSVLQHQDIAKAVTCYENALTVYDEWSLWHSLGDCYVQTSRFGEAVRAYRKAVDLGSIYFWTFSNLAFSASNVGDFGMAVEFCRKALQISEGSYHARNSLRKYALAQFENSWKIANVEAKNNNHELASSTIKEASDLYWQTMADVALGEPRSLVGSGQQVRVAIFGSNSIFQCKLYRIDQKIEQLSAVGNHVDYYPMDQAATLRNRLAYYDIVIVYRLPAVPEVLDVLSACQRYGISTFYDIDDLIFDDSCYPPSKSSFGNLLSDEEYAGLITGRNLFKLAIEKCDFGIASTPLIQAKLSGLVRKRTAFLHRNGLGRSHVNATLGKKWADRKFDDNVVLFYGSGSRSHNDNFNLVAPVLAEVMRNRLHVRLRLVGPLELKDDLRQFSDRIDQIEFVSNLEDYWTLLEDCHINIAPLVDNVFNDGKSEVKWIEASMLGIPSVVSSTAVYSEIINQCEDGFAAASLDDWGQALYALIDDPELRSRVGTSASKRVQKDYDLLKMGSELLGILNETAYEDERSVSTKPLVLVVNVFYPPQFIGGATRVVASGVQIAEQYSADFDVEVICARDSGGLPGEIDRYEWNGVTVSSYVPYDDSDPSERSAKTDALFADLYSRLKPDLIHFHCMQKITASPLDVARRMGVPYIVTVHDGWWISDRQFLIDANGTPVYETNDWGNPLRLARLRNALNQAEVTVAVSEKMGQMYSKRGVNNVLTIPNGASLLSDVTQAPKTGPVCLGLLGGLGMAKGADLLKTALIRTYYPNLRFVLVDHAALEGTVRFELWGENEVKIIGKTSFDNVGEVYSQLHVLLAISVCVESFGLVAREAARLGRWVVASDRGGIGEDVREGIDGFVIDVSSVKFLAGALDAINREPERYREPTPSSLHIRDADAAAHDIARLYKKILLEK